MLARASSIWARWNGARRPAWSCTSDTLHHTNASIRAGAARAAIRRPGHTAASAAAIPVVRVIARKVRVGQVARARRRRPLQGAEQEERRREDGEPAGHLAAPLPPRDPDQVERADRPFDDQHREEDEDTDQVAEVGAGPAAEEEEGDDRVRDRRRREHRPHHDGHHGAPDGRAEQQRRVGPHRQAPVPRQGGRQVAESQPAALHLLVRAAAPAWRGIPHLVSSVGRRGRGRRRLWVCRRLGLRRRQLREEGQLHALGGDQRIAGGSPVVGQNGRRTEEEAQRHGAEDDPHPRCVPRRLLPPAQRQHTHGRHEVEDGVGANRRAEADRQACSEESPRADGATAHRQQDEQADQPEDVGREVAGEGQSPEVHHGGEERDERRACHGAPGGAEDAPLERPRHREEDEIQGRVQVVRAIGAEDADPSRQQHREPRRVAAVEPPLIIDVGLDQDVGAGRKEGLQGLERRPLVEDPAVQEVVGEGEVAELVDGQVPRDLALERDRGGPEERQRRASPYQPLGPLELAHGWIRWSQRVSALAAWSPATRRLDGRRRAPGGASDRSCGTRSPYSQASAGEESTPLSRRPARC